MIADAITVQAARGDEEMFTRYAAACVAIGVSTGGPAALARLFAALAPPLPPVIVVQHMPEMFTRPFAARLNSVSSLTVKEAEDGDVVQPNCAYVAPGGKQLSVRRRAESGVIEVRDGNFCRRA